MEEKSTWKLIEEKEACMKRPGCGQWAEISARSRLKRKGKKKEREKIIKREKKPAIMEMACVELCTEQTRQGVSKAT